MHGQKYYNKPCGSFGEISTFSLYSNKFISSGEGGAICTNSKKIFKRFNEFRNLSFGNKSRFLHNELSYNARMSNLQAAVAYAQIFNLNKIIKKKYKIASYFNKVLSKCKYIEILPSKNKYSKNIYWVYGIIVLKKQKKNLVKFLNSRGIETRDFFTNMHNQPVIKKLGLINKKDSFPVSEKLEKNGIYLPSGPNISLKEINFIIKSIKDFFINKYKDF